MAAKRPLNDMQKAFCLEYIKDFNGSAAAKRAGYSEKTARTQGSQLLTKLDIQSRIKVLIEKRNKKLELSGEMVVMRLANIAFGHLGLICTWDAEKGLDLKDSEEMTEEEMAIVSEINVSPVSNGDGGLLGYNKKVKMKDSIKALELLSKHLGILDGKGLGGTDNNNVKDRLFSALDRLTAKKS